MFDRAKSEAIRHGINMMLKGRYGEITSMKLDSKQRKVDLQLQLNGEPEIIQIQVGRYEIDDRDPQRPSVVLSEMQISRKWMQELATDNLEGRSIEIPTKLTPVLKFIL